MTFRPCLTITMGDPAGIGPVVTVAALAHMRELLDTHRVIVVGHQRTLLDAAERLALTWRGQTITEDDLRQDSDTVTSEEVGVIEPEGTSSLRFEPGEPTHDGGRLQLAAIDIALSSARHGLTQAIVTGPVSKIAITRAGTPFTGHTEHLARAAGVAPDQVTMLFAGPKLKVALVTTHLPIRAVPNAITQPRLLGTIDRVVEALHVRWCLPRPRVVVLGLNPHAGEEGLLGDEEERIIAPVIEVARKRWTSCLFEGPIPSEAGLRKTMAGDFDCAIAHYHDQATIASKLVEMGQAVNVTLGLPFLRTSVDHGVAYDAAISGDVDPSSMQAALRLAAKLTIRRSETE